MDNTDDVPGYKYFLAPDGTRPRVFVAFLDLVPEPGATVNGVCSPVDPRLLDELDARERNYRRVDVTEQIAAPLGRTWAYAGSPGGRARFADGIAAAACVVGADYLGLVEAGFRRLGAHEYAAAAPSLATDGLPVRPLRRLDIPGTP